MINQNFGILAAVLALIGSVEYAWEVIRRKVRPHSITWLLWMIAPSITFAAELAEHTSLQVSLLTLAEGVGPLIVLLAIFVNRTAYWKTTRFDSLCGTLSLAALVVWAVTGHTTVAIAIGIFSSLAATAPTFIKAYRYPSTESPWDYILSTVAGILTILTIRHWTLANYGFPVYLTISSLLLSGVVLLSRGRGPIDYDSELDVLDVPVFAENPITVGHATIISVSLNDGMKPAAMEYFIGDNDPGTGNGVSMVEYNQDIFVAAIGEGLGTGEYTVSIRAKAADGAWNGLRSSTLVVVPGSPSAGAPDAVSPPGESVNLTV